MAGVAELASWLPFGLGLVAGFCGASVRVFGVGVRWSKGKLRSPRTSDWRKGTWPNRDSVGFFPDPRLCPACVSDVPLSPSTDTCVFPAAMPGGVWGTLVSICAGHQPCARQGEVAENGVAAGPGWVAKRDAREVGAANHPLLSERWCKEGSEALN